MIFGSEQQACHMPDETVFPFDVLQIELQRSAAVPSLVERTLHRQRGAEISPLPEH